MWLILFSAAFGLRAQTDSLLREGDRLHRSYRFEEALDHYARASASTVDADTIRLLRDRIDRSQNALNMTDFCADPVVVARERFSRQDFFLFYPLKNKSWRLPRTRSTLPRTDSRPTPSAAAVPCAFPRLTPPASETCTSPGKRTSSGRLRN